MSVDVLLERIAAELRRLRRGALAFAREGAAAGAPLAGAAEIALLISWAGALGGDLGTGGAL